MEGRERAELGVRRTHREVHTAIAMGTALGERVRAAERERLQQLKDALRLERSGNKQLETQLSGSRLRQFSDRGRVLALPRNWSCPRLPPLPHGGP